MHAAAGLNAKFIPLLARLPAEMLLTQEVTKYKLYDNSNVNNIKVKDILSNFYEVYYSIWEN